MIAAGLEPAILCGNKNPFFSTELFVKQMP